MVFMGDTGSLSTGGALGAVAVAAKHELVLLIIGGLFVLEAVSVIVQVASFKLTGRRVFRMAPLHHHFEKLGWKEPTIVIRFWIIAIDPGAGRPLHPEAAVSGDGEPRPLSRASGSASWGWRAAGLAAARALRAAGADVLAFDDKPDALARASAQGSSPASSADVAGAGAPASRARACR